MVVKVGVGLPLKPLGKVNNAYEVGEVGIVQQPRNLRTEPRDGRRRECDVMLLLMLHLERWCRSVVGFYSGR